MSFIEELLFQSEIIGKFIIALTLGFLIGLEREYSGKPAGMRTHSLIAASSAALVILGISVTQVFTQNFGTSLVSSDPTRIIHAIIVGISFLGAGAILKNDDSIENLTTAAGILASAAVGISVGLSLFYLAALLTVVIIVVSKGFMYVESWLNKRLESLKEKDPKTKKE
jgi:putative Mg2+ transporter-C (MgtC) family protein